MSRLIFFKTYNM